MMRVFILISAFILFTHCGSKTEAPSKTYTEEELTTYRETGLQLAMTLQQTLGSHLKAAIESGGPEHALEFCNIRAIPLTDSVSTALNASIKRISDQPRNPNNRANNDEVAIIEAMKNSLAEGESPQPDLVVIGDKVIGYYPIITNELCMNCHGNTKSDISESTLKKLQELYPTDQATGYGIGELRGVFKVEMDGK